MSTALKKVSGRMSYVKKGIEKVRCKSWSEPVGQSLDVTASICEGLGNFLPGAGLVGGALQMGSCLLNPKPTLADLRRTEEKLQSSLNDATGFTKEILEQKLEELREDIRNPQPEILQNFEVIKEQLQTSAIDISKDVCKIEEKLCDLKDIIGYTYSLVRDIRYKSGIEQVEAAYETFLRGSNNLETRSRRPSKS